MTREETTLQTLQEFMNKHNIRLGAVDYADENKNIPDWHDAHHYKVTLKCGRRTFSTYFSMGYAHSAEPTVQDVLNCLASDIASIINARSFEEWCADMGYDSDSRKAERTFKVIECQRKQLEKWLGSANALYELCFETERQ